MNKLTMTIKLLTVMKLMFKVMNDKQHILLTKMMVTKIDDDNNDNYNAETLTKSV